jgi:amidase
VIETRAADVRVPVILLSRDQTASAFDPGLTPRARVASGALLEIETHDARAGALLDEPSHRSFVLGPPQRTPNPLTGPIAIEGAEPGDALRVQIESIELGARGWNGAHAHTGGYAPGAISRALARVCDVEDDSVRFSDTIALPLAPMVGCIGTAPEQARSTQSAGTFGGNMDHPVIAPGAIVHLPVHVADALLFVGDAHARQGDGELSGLGLEIPAVVRMRVELRKRVGLTWPWVETGERVMVCAAAPTFEEARNLAVGAMLAALTSQLGLEPAEAMGLISIAGDLRLGAAWGAPETTVRLELPTSLGLRPE